MAVFESPSLPPLSVNDCRVLVDRSDLTARFANLKRETTVRVADTDHTGSRRFRQIVVQLIVGLGRQDTSELLDTYFSERPAQMYRALEVESFARFLTQRSELLDRVPYLREVLSYEDALVRATVLGEDSQIEWTADPTMILQALDHGHLPSSLPVVPSSIPVSA